MAKEWFDPHNIEHCKAYRHLQKTGFWPKGFELHDAELRGTTWQINLMQYMANAWIDQMLKQGEKDGFEKI